MLENAFKEQLLEIVRKDSETLILEWIGYFDEEQKDEEHRHYDDFLGFFEECVEADLDIQSAEVKALKHFLLKLKDIIGEEEFFHFHNSVYTCFLKFPLLKVLEQKGDFRYEYIKPISEFFEALTSSLIVELLSHNKEFQELSMQELADREAPISEIWDGILMVSIVGTLDSQRVLQIIDKVLLYLEKDSFEHVIVDISAIFDVNSEVASQLVKLNNAIHYMGSRAYLSGITAGIAKSMTHLDLNLGDIQTYSTTKKAVKHIVGNF